jgi:large conductance mechanosensitive channel
LAVGIIIGAAFGKIVTSFVNDIFMPPLGVILGGVNFKDLKITIGENIFWNYGAFIQSVVDFLIIAFAIFMLIKVMNKMKKKEEEKKAEDPKPSREEEILIEIRDELKHRNK